MHTYLYCFPLSLWLSHIKTQKQCLCWMNRLTDVADEHCLCRRTEALALWRLQAMMETTNMITSSAMAPPTTAPIIGTNTFCSLDSNARLPDITPRHVTSHTHARRVLHRVAQKNSNLHEMQFLNNCVTLFLYQTDSFLNVFAYENHRRARGLGRFGWYGPLWTLVWAVLAMGRFRPFPSEGDAFWDAQPVEADERWGNVFWPSNSEN